MSLDPAPFHPVVVHFAIALLIAGVLFRLLSFTGRFAFAGPAALVLLLTGTLAAVASVKSGLAAHEVAEDIPGAHGIVEEHQEWGERTRTLFLVVAGLEIVALVLRRFGKEKAVLVASAALGVVGIFFVYETGEHGGDVVYSYAGGVGTRNGDPKDVGRLLLAGLYQQALLDRDLGRHEDAARLVEEATRRWPGDPAVQIMAARSKLLDRSDPAAALEILAHLTIAKEQRRERFQQGMLLADALVASGQKDAARAALQALQAEFPQSTRLRDRLKAVSGSAAPNSSPSPAASPSPGGTPVTAAPSPS
jgi:uncharacterized membrane protein